MNIILKAVANMDEKMTYTDDQKRWRERQEEEDKRRDEFYSQINQFPNLFTLKRAFHVRHRIQRLLEKQQKGAESERHQHPLEQARAQNLVVFLLLLLDRKAEALDYCEQLLPSGDRSIITLTNLAVLQWELGQREESIQTVSLLHELHKAPDFIYLHAAATAEQGYTFISFGPKYFLRAIDMFESAITQCPDGDVWLWKYDLALAIRRNFNVFAFSEHSTMSAAHLAQRGVELLRDTSVNCPNALYRAKSFVELASLVSSLKQFKNVCKEADRREISKLSEENHMNLLQRALAIPEGRENSYVLRSCGRYYGWDKNYEQAMDFLLKARQMRDESIVNQVLAKTLLASIRWAKRSRGRGGGGWRADKGRVQGSGHQQYGRPAWRGRRGGDGAYGGSQSYQSYSQPQYGRHGEEHTPPSASGKRNLVHMLKTARATYDQHDPEDPDVKRAEQYFLKALELDPYNHGAVYDTGILYQGMNKWETALHYFQQIVASSDPLIGSLQLVNAYEQVGLCLLEMSEEEGRSGEERSQLVSRAEEMLKGCVRECRLAVINLPGLDNKRIHLWESYSRLRRNLQKGSDAAGTGQLERRSGVLDLLGEFLEGLPVYQDVFQLGRNVADRKGDLLQLINNYLSRNGENEAKFVLDLFLSSDKRDVILDGDDEVSIRLRETAVDVYTRSAHEALKNGLLRDARLGFQGALLIRGLVKGGKPAGAEDEIDAGAGQGAEDEGDDDVDVCVFDDDRENAPLVSRVSSALTGIVRDVFGMSVSLNDEAGPPGLLRFDGELQLARSTRTAILVLPPGQEAQLSPRMTYIANVALESQEHDQGKRVLPVVMATRAQPVPYPLHEAPAFREANELLPLTDQGVDLAAHSDTIIKLFQFIIT